MEQIIIKFKWRDGNFKAVPCGYSYFAGQCRWAIYDEDGTKMPYYDPRIKNYPVVTDINKYFFREVFPKSKYANLTPKMRETKLIKNLMKEEAKKFTVLTIKNKD